MVNWRLNLVVLGLTLLRIGVSIFWFYWAIVIFGLHVSFTEVAVISLANEFSLIIRFVPGNIGVDEFVAGGVLSVMGGTVGEGVLIMLFLRFSSLVLTFTVGVWGT